jgi:hypothetical protein
LTCGVFQIICAFFNLPIRPLHPPPYTTSPSLLGCRDLKHLHDQGFFLNFWLLRNDDGPMNRVFFLHNNKKRIPDKKIDALSLHLCTLFLKTLHTILDKTGGWSAYAAGKAAQADIRFL